MVNSDNIAYKYICKKLELSKANVISKKASFLDLAITIYY